MIVSVFSCDTNNDSTKPVITVLGSNPQYSQLDSAYTDQGATAYDETDGDITDKIEVIIDVDINTQGYDYHVYYNVKDKAGNEADEVVRKVIVLPF